uniref:Cardiolipin synthase n=1 Tax=Eimeria falciformis TaxID=84963 RepID=A0A221S604_9EIME|nr:cardiolipin synthase [Eimeria falciformis]
MVLLQSLLPAISAAAAAATTTTAAPAASCGDTGYRRCYVCGRSSSSSSSSGGLRQWLFGPSQLQLQQQQQQQLSRCSRVEMQHALRRSVHTLQTLQAEEAAAKGLPAPDIDYDLLERRWCGFLSSVEKHGKTSTGNIIQVYSDGDATLHAMLEAIGSAEHFVFLESYIFDSSPPAAKVKDALKAAAARGCVVILLIDGVGSFDIASSWIAELLHAGAHVAIFNPPLPSAFYSAAVAAAGAAATAVPAAAAAAAAGELHALRVGPLALRDHRKTLVVDGWKAFVGSFNISQDATSPLTGGNGRFQDLHAKLCGPAALDLGYVFLHSLQAAEAATLAQRAESCLEQVGNPWSCGCVSADREHSSLVQVLESDVVRGRRGIQRVLQEAIQTASRSLHLGTAYFTPPGFLRRVLLQQIKGRHTDVLLLLSGDSDVWCDVPATTYVAHKLFAARELGRPLQDWLLLRRTAATLQQQQQEQQEKTAAAGVGEAGPLLRLLRFLRGGETESVLRGELQIHFTRLKHYHAKNLVADKLWASIGSFNFDRLSARRNLEVCVGVCDAQLATQLAKLQEAQASEATEFTAASWRQLSSFKKTICFFAYHILRFTGKNVFDGLSDKRNKETLNKSIKVQRLKEAALPAIAAPIFCGC